MKYGITYTRRIRFGYRKDVTVGFLNKYNEGSKRFINFKLRVPNSREIPKQMDVINGLIEYLISCGFKIICNRPYEKGDEKI